MSGERTETATGIGTQMRIDNGELVEVIAEERWFVVKVIGGTGPPGGLRRVCDGTTACGSAVEYMPRERVRPTAKDPRFIDIVHSVPPGPDSTLVEVEDEDGRGMRLGEWVERQDGTWALRIHAGDIEATMLPRRERATNCPRCDSPDPKRHPAMQFEGEVQVCPDPFHGDELAALRERMAKGRKKYPNGCTVLSLIDEAGEVAHTVNKYGSADSVRDELLDTAAVAMRLYLGEIDRGLEIDGLVQRRTEGSCGKQSSSVQSSAPVSRSSSLSPGASPSSGDPGTNEDKEKPRG